MATGNILTSLPVLDEARRNTKSSDLITNPESHLVEYNTSTQEGEEPILTPVCHLSVLNAFTQRTFLPSQPAFEDTAVVALAAQHLNTGDGSIVPELAGLNQRCKLRFTTEFSDTRLMAAVAMSHVVQQAHRDPDDEENRRPCAFVGAYASSSSIPSSMASGVLGYPQVSGSSSSAELDDRSQHPLFGRTVPSDQGNTIPTILYMRNQLNITHLAILNVNNGYGNAYAEAMRLAAQKYAPDMVIHQVPMDELNEDTEDNSAIEAAVTSLKESKFRFIFALVMTIPTQDKLMLEAYRQGVAGTGEHNWLWSGVFSSTLTGRVFERDSPLHLAYRGHGMIVVTGGVSGIPQYENFVSKITELKNHSEDMEYLGSVFPKYNETDYFTQGTPPFIHNEESDFLEDKITSIFAPFWFEATVALGLAACAAHEENPWFTGVEHFEKFKQTQFMGITGYVTFDPETGSRDPNSALYTVTNFVDQEVEEGNTTHISFNRVLVDMFQNSEWVKVDKYIFNDGTTNLPADLPPPPPPVEIVAADSDDWVVPVVVGIVIGILLLVGGMVFWIYEKRRRDNDSVWQVRKQELVFDNPPEIVGTGSFGQVMLAEYRGTQVAVKKVLPPRHKPKKECAGSHAWNRSSNSGASTGCSDDESEMIAEVISGTDSRNFGTMSRTGRTSGILSSWGLTSLGDPKKSMNSDAELTKWKRLRKEFMSEMAYLSKLRHPNVISILGAVVDDEEPMLVMEYMHHGSLHDILHNETMVIEPEIIVPIIRDVSQGMRFLHSADPIVVHGDLKAANILVDSHFRAKISDFGLSQKSQLGGTGTPYWMAPELLRRETPNTPASDIYSFGIILYEIYSRKDPYFGETDPRNVLRLVADKAVRKRPQPIPKHMPTEVQALMKDCLEESVDKRPDCQELDVRVKRIEAEPEAAGNKTTISLFDIFPRHIAEALRDGKTVEPEHKDSVTIFFSDIVGFTTISSKLAPREVASLLDRLYQKFDSLSHQHDVFKVETIGDAYMAVTNLVKDQSEDHVKRIAAFAIDALKAANETPISLEDESKGCVNIRVGFHTGPVVADVVGSRNPRYCLFGDTVNTASRMESNSKQNRIHCSNAAAKLLKVQWPEMALIPRGKIEVKGKGKMATFWVNESNADDKITLEQEDVNPFETSSKLPLAPLEEVSGEFLLASERGTTPHSSAILSKADLFDIEAPPEQVPPIKDKPKKGNGPFSDLVEKGGKWLRLQDEVLNDEVSV